VTRPNGMALHSIYLVSRSRNAQTREQAQACIRAHQRSGRRQRAAVIEKVPRGARPQVYTWGTSPRCAQPVDSAASTLGYGTVARSLTGPGATQSHRRSIRHHASPLARRQFSDSSAAQGVLLRTRLRPARREQHGQPLWHTPNSHIDLLPMDSALTGPTVLVHGRDAPCATWRSECHTDQATDQMYAAGSTVALVDNSRVLTRGCPSLIADSDSDSFLHPFSIQIFVQLAAQAEGK
jgi:hypothetical protein